MPASLRLELKKLNCWKQLFGRPLEIRQKRAKKKGIKQLLPMPNPLFFLWCRRPDLNRHERTPTRP